MVSEELVSVIMPTYNAGEYLADSIASVLHQTYANLELLVTDDASTDPTTLGILHEMEERDKRVKVLYLDRNHGAGYARNKSIERAKGRYIAFCDSDDRWTTDKLRKQIDFMEEKHCALSCTSYLIYDLDQRQAVGINIAPAQITLAMMRRDNKIGCLTAIYDTQSLGRKYYMPTLRKRQDWAMFLQILMDCKVCLSYPDEPLALYGRHERSMSNKKISLAKYNIAVYRKILGFNPLKARLYFALVFLPTYGRKVLKRKIDSRRFVRRKGYNDDVANKRYIPDGMNELERNTKRIGDFLLACVCMVAFSPLMLACYVMVRREDGGPAIFRQERIGRFGRPFYIYKFRSMRIDAEKTGPQLSGNEHDKRLTRIGKFLRDHHLDELPQLWNVMRGDMAFIGPRPERKFYIDQIIERDPRYVYLYQIRPGVTSYATLYNGYTDTMEKMLRRLDLDLFYLEHRSWWFDAKILFKTFVNIAFGKIF